MINNNFSQAKHFGAISSGIDKKQGQVAQSQGQYKDAVLSGDSSKALIRNEEAKQKESLSYKRQDSSFAVIDTQAELDARKNEVNSSIASA